MKQTLLPVLLLTALSLHAQNPGCDGVRYKVPSFPATTKTTVQFATASSYFPNQTVNLAADIYQPAGDTCPLRPAIVLAHGGSFIFGDKADLQTTCELIASEGYVVLSVNYRLYPLLILGFPDSIEIMDAAMKAVGDMKAAVRFLREDAAGNNVYKIDPDFIFLGGYSAGAVAALHAAYIDSTDTPPAFIQSAIDANGGLEGNTGTIQNHSFSSTVKAVINMSGGLYRASWLDAGEEPLSSIHGTADDVVPYTAGLAANLAYLQGSSMVHQRAQSVGVWSELTTVTGGGHTDIYSSPNFAPQLTAYFVSTSAMLETLVCNFSGVETAATEVAGTWSVFPNPASDYTTLHLPEGVLSAEVNVFTANSRRVYAQSNVTDGFRIQTSAWPAGLYWVQLRDTDNPGRVIAPKLMVKG